MLSSHQLMKNYFLRVKKSNNNLNSSLSLAFYFRASILLFSSSRGFCVPAREKRVFVTIAIRNESRRKIFSLHTDDDNWENCCYYFIWRRCDVFGRTYGGLLKALEKATGRGRQKKGISLLSHV
jgi:hypothetical protein